MKAKDIICVVGAPTKTVAEGIGIVLLVFLGIGTIAGLGLGFQWLIKHYANPISDHTAMILLYILGGFVVLLYGGGLLTVGYQRMIVNYNKCKEYWNSEE